MTSTDSKNEPTAGTWAEGKAEGFAEGHRFGRSEGLRQSIHDLCEVLAIELTAEREALIHGSSDADLTALREHLKRGRTWP